MRIGDASEADLRARLRGTGLRLDFGSARARIRSDAPGLADALRTVYGAFPIEDDDGFDDVTVSVRRARGVRRFVVAQVVFETEGEVPFEPFPADTHLPLLEWGLNFLFAQRLNHRLLLHAGAVECAGRAIVLPAMPGSGKSTLTAALARSGFRLLSDEFGVLGLDDGRLHPLLRPIALKNASIGVIRALSPDARIGPEFPKTRKGTVAHLAPDAQSCARRHEPAEPALVLFPRYDPAAAPELTPVKRSRAFSRVALNSFNYELLGPDGFDAVAALIERCPCWQITYRDLPQAIAAVRDLLGRATQDPP
jgi:HprK-related kinase A